MRKNLVGRVAEPMHSHRRTRRVAGGDEYSGMAHSGVGAPDSVLGLY